MRCAYCLFPMSGGRNSDGSFWRAGGELFCCSEHAAAIRPTGERCHCGRPADEAWGGTCGNDWCIAWERSMRGGMAR